MIDTSNGKATEADLAATTKLLETVKAHLGSSHPNVRKAKLSAWVDHLRLLRTKDDVSEARIDKVLGWYATHIGEEFIPEAYAGESFRRKFHTIERQMDRDVVATVEVGPEAKKIATRLRSMGWPKGSGSSVPAATQACLEAYREWQTNFRVFLDKLHRDDLVEDYGHERRRLHQLGKSLKATMPHAAHFVERWMEDVYKDVRGWEAWSGDFGAYIFKPGSKRFRSMARGWAKRHCGQAKGWDRFMEVMKSESE